MKQRPELLLPVCFTPFGLLVATQLLCLRVGLFYDLHFGRMGTTPGFGHYVAVFTFEAMPIANHRMSSRSRLVISSCCSARWEALDRDEQTALAERLEELLDTDCTFLTSVENQPWSQLAGIMRKRRRRAQQPAGLVSVASQLINRH